MLCSERGTRILLSLLGALHMAYLATVPWRVYEFDFVDKEGPVSVNKKIVVFMAIIFWTRFLLVFLEPPAEKKKTK